MVHSKESAWRPEKSNKDRFSLAREAMSTSLGTFRSNVPACSLCHRSSFRLTGSPVSAEMAKLTSLIARKTRGGRSRRFRLVFFTAHRSEGAWVLSWTADLVRNRYADLVDE